jgi:hypothetical protein
VVASEAPLLHHVKLAPHAMIFYDEVPIFVITRKSAKWSVICAE